MGSDPNQLEWLTDYDHAGQVELLVGVRGDMDFDQDVDFDDIEDFIDGLNTPAGYLTTFGHGSSASGDMDSDGDQDFDDIDDFVVRLLGGSPVTGNGSSRAVPEPSTWCLATLGLLGVVACGWRRHFARMFKRVVLLFVVVAMVAPGEAMGSLITLTPIQDNTLYETVDGSLSNGAGAYLFAGRSSDPRRAVMAFDIAGNVPAGSIIQSLTLTLEMSRTRVGAKTFNLHRLTSDWGEGTSNAGGHEGAGTDSTANDATWLHTFYPASSWSTPGGDFDATLSASTLVGGEGSYSWGSTAQMVADVQSWLDTPANNYGWILKGPEGVRSSKRFNSREHSNAVTRPTLVIEFVSGGPEIFNWVGTDSGGSFHDNTNWDTNQAPSSSTDIVKLIDTELTDQVATLSSSVTVDDLTINGKTNSMSLSIGQGLVANVGDLQIGSLGGLAVELATGASGQLNSSGPATLAGTVALSTPGTTPAPTESFGFLTYDSRTGTFDTITGHEIEPDRSFSLHYNGNRALAIAGEWAASGEELAGDIDVPLGLLVGGAWDWNGMLIKRGDGELVLDVDGGFSVGTGAALAIVDGTMRLHGAAGVLSLDALTFGELGELTGDTSLAGQHGWYGAVTAVPEPSGRVLIVVGLLGFVAFPSSRA